MSARGQVLVTGATGALGDEVVRQLAGRDDVSVVATSRRGDEAAGVVAWDLREAPPSELDRSWDAVVHCAASTRWTATPEEAHRANVTTVETLLAHLRPGSRLVHVSTAFVQRDPDDPFDLSATEVEDYRNPYEWSKAQAERMVWDRHPNVCVVRPPLIMGRRGDGAIRRFAGTYSLLAALTSGIAAAVLGDVETHVELAPVDEVAAVIVDDVVAGRSGGRLEVVAAGEGSITLGRLIGAGCEELNIVRRRHGVPDLDPPPFIPSERWHRFFLPLAREWLSHRQLQALDVLEAFHAYTAESIVFRPTVPVARPEDVLRASVRHWARTHERPALRVPREWVAAGDRAAR